MKISIKKALSAVIAATISLSMMAAVSADNNPKVYVDRTLVTFPDQEAVIVGEGTTLIPARGVFNAMGASVKWDGELRRVQIDSADNITRIYITIDNPVMEVRTFTSVFESTGKEITLGQDSVPRIMNDRTMIPLRAISESLNADVQWDGEAYAVNITTKDAAAVDETNMAALSLSSEATDVKEGDMVDIYINTANLPMENMHLSTISALVNYDPSAFEHQSSSLYFNGEEKDATINITTPDYTDTSLKVGIVMINPDITENGKIVKLTFKALSNKGGEFSLGNTYELVRGHGTMLSLGANDENDNTSLKFAGNNLNVDTAPLVIKGAE